MHRECPTNVGKQCESVVFKKDSRYDVRIGRGRGVMEKRT